MLNHSGFYFKNQEVMIRYTEISIVSTPFVILALCTKSTAMKDVPAGYSLVELLITLGFVSVTLSSVSAATLYTEHHLAAMNQILCAEQILTNIATDLLGTQYHWTTAMQAQWRSDAAQWLPGSVLRLNSNHIEIHWPALTSLEIHCQTKDSGYSCLGLDLEEAMG